MWRYISGREEVIYPYLGACPRYLGDLGTYPSYLGRLGMYPSIPGHTSSTV